MKRKRAQTLRKLRTQQDDYRTKRLGINLKRAF